MAVKKERPELLRTSGSSAASESKEDASLSDLEGMLHETSQGRRRLSGQEAARFLLGEAKQLAEQWEEMEEEGGRLAVEAGERMKKMMKTIAHVAGSYNIDVSGVFREFSKVEVKGVEAFEAANSNSNSNSNSNRRLHISVEGNFGTGTSQLADELHRHVGGTRASMSLPSCSLPSWLISSLVRDYGQYATAASVSPFSFPALYPLLNLCRYLRSKPLGCFLPLFLIHCFVFLLALISRFHLLTPSCCDKCLRFSAQLVRDLRSQGFSSIVDSSSFFSSAFLRANARYALLPPELDSEEVGGDWPQGDVLLFLHAPPSLCARRIEEEGAILSEGALSMIERLDEELFKNLLLLLLEKVCPAQGVQTGDLKLEQPGRLETSLVPEDDNTIYIEDPYALGEDEDEEDGEPRGSSMAKIRAAYRQCVLFLLARLKDVVLIRD
eukprot:765700-Hanusia_phi.AAC.8